MVTTSSGSPTPALLLTLAQELLLCHTTNGSPQLLAVSHAGLPSNAHDSLVATLMSGSENECTSTQGEIHSWYDVVTGNVSKVITSEVSLPVDNVNRVMSDCQRVQVLLYSHWSLCTSY